VKICCLHVSWHLINSVSNLAVMQQGALVQACTHGLLWTEILNLAFCCLCLALNARKLLEPPYASLSLVMCQRDMLTREKNATRGKDISKVFLK
jgi:hypothetical protein